MKRQGTDGKKNRHMTQGTHIEIVQIKTSTDQ